MLCSIDTCQNKVSANQYHMTMTMTGSGFELVDFTCFLKLTAAQVLVFNWIAG